MKWKKYSIKTVSEAVDLISNLLNEIGIEGIEIIDKIPLSEDEKKRMFIDIVPDAEPDDGKADVVFYLDDAIDQVSEKEYLDQIAEGLKEISEFVDIGNGNIMISVTDEEDWIDNWKTFFKPFRVDDSIVIKPTWEEYHDRKEDDIVIEIDPGRAFGTGSHETTKLCIQAMKKQIKAGDSVLDLGSGSGILSIAAMKLGAKNVVGTDIDQIAVDVSRENAVLNQYDGEEAQFYELNVIESSKDRLFLKDKYVDGFDVVIANILADVIIPLSGVVSAFMKDDAVFISSGIIESKAVEVKEALIKNGFQVLDTLTMGEWVSYVAILEKS